MSERVQVDAVTEIALAIEARRAPALDAAIAYENGAWDRCEDPVAIARVLCAAGELGPDRALAKALLRVARETEAQTTGAGAQREAAWLLFDAERSARRGRVLDMLERIGIACRVWGADGAERSAGLALALCDALRGEQPIAPSLRQLMGER